MPPQNLHDAPEAVKASGERGDDNCQYSMNSLKDDFKRNAVDRITAALDEIAAEPFSTPVSKLTTLKTVHALLALKMAQLIEAEIAKTDLPETAPLLYKDREKYKESPVDFLRRVWGPWIVSGQLTKKALRDLDPALAASYATWCSRNGGPPPDVNLPSQRTKNDELLAQLGGPDGEMIKNLLRFYKMGSRLAAAMDLRRTP